MGLEQPIAGRRKLRLGLLLASGLATAGLAAAPPAAEVRSIDTFAALPRLLVEDGKQVLESRSHWDAEERSMAWTGLAVVLGAALLFDQPVDRAIQKSSRQANWARTAADLAPLGSTPGVLLAVVTYAGGAALREPEVRATGTDAIAAIAIAELAIAVPLKVLAGRSRPYSDEGSHALHPFAGGVSFPSGHTTVAFALASVLSEHADRPWVSGVAYGLASLVGAARIAQRSHFLSDVVAGGLIGTFVGKVVVGHNRLLRGAGTGALELAVSPVLLDGGCGVRLSARF